jgi:hypothetical protein
MIHLRMCRAAVSCAVILAALCMPSAATAGAAAPIPAPPSLGLSGAVRIAEQWIRDHGVDVSGQYMDSARLCWDDDPGRKRRYWHVQWLWAAPRMGGEFGARVYMDGTVVPQRCGP